LRADRDSAALHCGPLAALALFDDPADQARACADWIARKVLLPGPPLTPAQGYDHPGIPQLLSVQRLLPSRDELSDR
jgi:hypothetical protein